MNMSFARVAKNYAVSTENEEVNGALSSILKET